MDLLPIISLRSNTEEGVSKDISKYQLHSSTYNIVIVIFFPVNDQLNILNMGAGYFSSQKNGIKTE